MIKEESTYKMLKNGLTFPTTILFGKKEGRQYKPTSSHVVTMMIQFVNGGWRSFLERFKDKIYRKLWTHTFLKRLKSKIRQKCWTDDFSYKLWIKRNEPDEAALKTMRMDLQSWAYRPKISIVTPVYNPSENDMTQCIKSVLDQIYDNWELCLVDGGSTESYVKKVINNFANSDPRIKFVLLSKNHGIAGNSNEALKIATGEYVGFLDHDDMLASFALYEVVKLLNQSPTTDFIYSDEDKISQNGKKRCDVHFKPDWSPDTLLSYNYVCHFTVVRRSLVEAIGGFREEYDGSQGYDLILRIVQKTNHIKRIPKILYHWRATQTSTALDPTNKPDAYLAGKKAIVGYLQSRELDAEVLDGIFLGCYRVKYEIKSPQKVSIIIPTKNKAAMLKQCVFSVLNKTHYKNFELLIIDNHSTEQETFEFYNNLKEDQRIRIISYKEAFNFSAINNYAVRHTNSPYLLFLNNDTEVISSGWLSSLLEFVQRKDVGAVGAKLYYPNNTIQHAGVIIGLCKVAGHSHKYCPRSSHGYTGRVNVIQNLSAVTAACMMIRREVFEEVGGFDERFSHAFNDVDLCLKVREKGYLVIYTPYAELYHHESVSRGYENTPERKTRFAKETELMQCKWKHVFEKGDPYYNPNLTLDREDFGVNLET